jgi:hypothetical protein
MHPAHAAAMLCKPFACRPASTMLTPASFDDHAARRRRLPLPLPAPVIEPPALQRWAGGRRRPRARRRRGGGTLGFGLRACPERRRCGR